MSRRERTKIYSVPGLPGPVPKHEWNGKSIRFQKSDDTWGDWHDISGVDGKDGDAYSIAVGNGFKGTSDEWLSSLKAVDGKDGKDGDSAYKIAVKNGFVGTVSEWLSSLKGDKGRSGEDGTDGTDGADGADGLSAYEVWLQLGNTGTEDDFFQWIANKVKNILSFNNGIGAGPLRLYLKSLSDVNVSNAENGDVLKFDGIKWNSEKSVCSFGITIDGGVTSGFKKYQYMPFSMVITGWSLIADASGDLEIDVWKDTSLPMDDSNTITGSQIPNLVSSQFTVSDNVDEWDNLVLSGEIIGFNVNSVSSINWATLTVFGYKL